MGKLSNTKEFIDKAKKVHGDKYDYSLVKYTNRKDKVKLICKAHGVFEQRAGNHVSNKRGCPKCRIDNLFLTTDAFVKKAANKHGNRYDYSLTSYSNNQTLIKIICNKHGIFEQTPANHLAGRGCNKCHIEKKILQKEIFLKKAKETHGDEYDYSLVEYANLQNKIKIICYKHGSFSQRAASHLKGCGCPICKSSKGEKTIRLYLEKNNFVFEQEKIFEECKNPETGYYLRFDFCVYVNEKIYLIEFDGKQHFINNERWEHPKKIQQRDEIKNNFAKENKINLIRIPYTKIKKIKEIEEILNKFLSSSRGTMLLDIEI